MPLNLVLRKYCFIISYMKSTEIYMHNLNKITKDLGIALTIVSGASVFMLGGNSAFAETVTTATVTATVQNAFTLVETTPLSFGTVRAVADPTGGVNIAILTLSPAGVMTPTTGVANSALTSLSGGTAGVFTVSGAASFTNLTVTFPVDFTLTTAGAPPGSPVFDIKQADWVGTIVGGVNGGSTYAASNMQTDVSGGVALRVGTKLKTDSTVGTTSQYLDQLYSGTYTMEIAY
jgi:hypothetical protein